MAYSVINKSSSFMNSALYTGNGATKAVTGVGFQPDLVWIKNRSAAFDHQAFDVTRGVQKRISPNTTSAQTTQSGSFTAFGADGFTVDNYDPTNQLNDTFVGWNWKAGTTSGITQGSATITPSSYSFNATSGFSIIKFTTPGSGTGTIPHGLGVAPKVIIGRITGSSAWQCGFTAMNSAWTSIMTLNSNSAEITSNAAFGDTPPDSTLFTMNSANWGASSEAIAYCFSEIPGYSKFGSYIGNGNADGTFVYTGFKPSWIMTKRTDSTNQWIMLNDKMSLYNNNTGDELYGDLSNAQNSFTDGGQDFLSNGFKCRGTNASLNSSGGTYIYMAFGQPIISNGGVCATAR